MKADFRAALHTVCTIGAALLIVPFAYFSYEWVAHVVANRYFELRMFWLILLSFTDHVNLSLVSLLVAPFLYALMLLSSQLLGRVMPQRVDQLNGFLRMLGGPGLDRLVRSVRLLGFMALGVLIAANLGNVVERASVGSDRPNLVWIVIDTLRADHLGSYGYERDTSPFLDEFASEGIRFERAISQEAYTMASAASYFTSTHPVTHKVMFDHPYIDILHPRFVTVAEALREEGYSTAAFIYNPHLKARYNFGQGFDLYDDYERSWAYNPNSSKTYHEWFETAQGMISKVRKFLDRSSRRPAFLYMHYLDVHSPYAPPPPYDEMFLPPGSNARTFEPSDRSLKITEKEIDVVVAQYDGEIRYTDKYIREMFALLESEGITRENSVIIITADHGEEFLDSHPNDPGWVGHGRTLYEEQIHVPLLMAIPDDVAARVGISSVRGTEVKEPVALIDLMPTLFELLAINVDRFDSQLQGRSLIPLLRGEGRGSKWIYAGGLRGRGSLLHDNWKYYRHFGLPINQLVKRSPPGTEGEPIEELYDLSSDPAETVNLIASHRELSIQMKEQLAAFERGFASGESSPSLPLDTETREALRALGYIE